MVGRTLRNLEHIQNDQQSICGGTCKLLVNLSTQQEGQQWILREKNMIVYVWEIARNNKSEGVKKQNGTTKELEYRKNRITGKCTQI